MKRTIPYLILAAVIVTAVIGATVGQPWLSQQPWLSRLPWLAPPAEDGAPTALVERGTLLLSVSATGRVVPEARVALSLDVPGRVAEVLAEPGDAVQAGDPLVRLDGDQLTLQVEQAKAGLEAAQAQLALLKAGARPEELAAAEAGLRAAQAQASAAAANLDQLVNGAGDAQIAAAEAQVAAAELQHRVALIAHDKTMAETEDETTRDQARSDLYAAEKALAAAKAGLDAALAGADADMVRAARAAVLAAAAQQDAAQAQLDMLLAGATDEQISGVEAQVAQAQTALELAELMLDHATLRAPFDGVVAEVNVAAGEIASAGLPVIDMLDASKYRVGVGVDEIDVGQLKEGQAVQVTLDALPDVELTGTIERIAPDATTQAGVVYYEAIIKLDSTNASIKADMTATATILVEQLSEVLMIPTWVVRIDRDTGQTYVLRRTGEEVERVDIQLGARGNGVVQVLNCLDEGDVLVLIQEEMIDVIREEMR